MTTPSRTTPIEATSSAPPAAERKQPLPAVAPAVEVREENARFVILADVPGADESSLDVTLDGATLTVSARVTLPAPEGYQLVHQEYAAREFRRSFDLTDQGVDPDGISASVKHGVLTLSLAKARPAQRKIDVRFE